MSKRPTRSKLPLIAYCNAKGVIGFGRVMPAGMLPIISGRAKWLRETMSAMSRHAYDGKTLLVPGIPEANNQAEGVKALIKFRKWVQGCAARNPEQRTADEELFSRFKSKRRKGPQTMPPKPSKAKPPVERS
jgi:hypothetical protein